MTRVQTVVLALLVMHFLLGGISLAVARGQRSAALRYWGYGLFAWAAGLTVSQLGLLPRGLAATLGNVLIAWAPILSIEGVLANTRHRLDRRWTYGALALAAVALAAHNLAGNGGAFVNALVPALVAIVLFMIGARWLLREPPARAETAAIFLATVMLTAVVVWLFRLAFLGLSASITRDQDTLDLIVALIAAVQLIAAVACTLGLFWIEVRKLHVALTQDALSDALTGLPNRKAMLARFHEEESKAVRYGTRFAILLLDVDHFKAFNDRYGQAIGDDVLRHVGDCLARTRRAGDVIGRMGGEEFVLILHGDLAVTQPAADRLRQTVQESTFDCQGASLSVTVSGGLATFPVDGVDWDTLFAVADKRLYFAKRNGRNRVTSE